MVRFDDIKFDCRLYNGYKPCIYGNECSGCPHYDPHNTTSPGWFPKLERDSLSHLPPKPRILVIKTAALGDVLRTTTLLHPLRRAFPSAHVTWITASPAVPLLAANPLIDVLLPFTDVMVEDLLNQLFDLVICLEKEDQPLALAGLVNAAHKVGYFPTPWTTAAVANEESRYMLVLGVSDELKFFRNQKSYPEIICEAAGLPFTRDPYTLNLTPAGHLARRRIISLLERRNAASLPVIGLNTGCGAVFRTKQWTLEGWAGTALALQRDGRATVMLMGGAAEADLNRAIIDQVPGVIDTGTDNPLEDFFGIVDACDVVVTSDSLGMHVAIAREKYVVALFGSTSHNEIDLYDRGEKIITDFPCSPCYLKTCDKKPMCMEAMSADTVVSAVMRGLQSLDRPAAPFV